MDIQEKLIQNYPLINKVDCDLNCYCLANEFIEKDAIIKVLKSLEEKTNNSNFSEFKTLIIVGKTKEEYKKEELLYFNNVNMIVVFYLINEEVNKIYMNDSWVFTLGLNYKKYIRKINEIMTQ